jgi:hypothetical protein
MRQISSSRKDLPRRKIGSGTWILTGTKH